MNRFTHGFIGLISVAVFLGWMTVVMPLGSEAEAGGKKHLKKHIKQYFENHVSNKELEDLILMLKDQTNMVKDQLTTLQTTVDNLPSGGGGTAGPCDVPPVWDEDIDNSQANNRFVSALGGSAYCDKETGLTWEGSPDTTTRTWNQALSHCADKTVGGKKGWRLPSFAGLASLVDTTQGPPTLPANHPFIGVQSTRYWSATTNSAFPTLAWGLTFVNGTVGSNAFFLKTNTPTPTSVNFVWCVRGGGPLSEY